MEVRTLREWRLKRGYGVREFARITGVTANTIVELEAGRRRGWTRTWRELARALGIEPGQIAEYRKAFGLDPSPARGAGGPRRA